MVDDFVASVLPARETASVRRVLEAVSKSEDPALLVVRAVDLQGPIVAIGTATKSMHDYSHWGICIPCILPGYEQSIQVETLLRNLIGHTESNKDNTVVDERFDPSGRPVLKNPAESLALSAGTKYPEVFQRCGFHTVHTHQLSSGDTVHWMMRVSPNEQVSYSTIDFSEPTVMPARHPQVRPLEHSRDYEQARAIITAVWGREAAHHFDDEVAQLRDMPGSEFYGYFEGERLLGLGAIVKALHHDEAWSRAWIITDEAERGKGVATKVIQYLLAHADEHHEQFSAGPVVMEGYTYIPDYYRRYGNMPVASRVLSTRTGFWTMRVTPASTPAS
jgi:GNAT superfamily N-acetyltransferase